jgi:hypothetical protein
LLRFTVACFLLGWAFILAVAFGLIAQDSRLGFGPLVFLMPATMVGITGAIEEPEHRTRFVLLAIGALVSVLAYAVMRYWMLFAWAGH